MNREEVDNFPDHDGWLPVQPKPVATPAEHIARNWYKDMLLQYQGVDFGEVMAYDTLQIVNRAILQSEVKKE